MLEPSCAQTTTTQLLFLRYKYITQARSQAEASKPGLQHHMGIDTRNPDFS